MPPVTCRRCGWATTGEPGDPEAAFWLAAHPGGVCRGPGRPASPKAIPALRAAVKAMTASPASRIPIVIAADPAAPSAGGMAEIVPLEQTKPAKRRRSEYRERKQAVHTTEAGRGRVARTKKAR